MLAGWVIRRDFTRGGSREQRFRGWLMFAFGALGWCVWAPTALLVIPRAADWSLVMFPAGLTVGVFAGHLLGKMLAVVVADEPDEESDDDAD